MQGGRGIETVGHLNTAVSNVLLQSSLAAAKTTDAILSCCCCTMIAFVSRHDFIYEKDFGCMLSNSFISCKQNLQRLSFNLGSSYNCLQERKSWMNVKLRWCIASRGEWRGGNKTGFFARVRARELESNSLYPSTPSSFLSLYSALEKWQQKPPLYDIYVRTVRGIHWRTGVKLGNIKFVMF